MGARFRLTTSACLCWLVASPVVVAQSPAGGTADPAPGRLGAVLKKRGYVAVPLSVGKAGWLDVKVEVNGTAMRLILDTGANNTNLDRQSAAGAKLEVEERKATTAAVGGTIPTGWTKTDRFAIGELKAPAEAFVVDFGPTNATRKSRGDPPCDGVLGGNCLAYWSAVVDVSGARLYVLDPARRAKRLANVFQKAGFAPVPLTLNKSGLLDVVAEVDGSPVSLFLDTGYLSVVTLDAAAAGRLKLAVREAGGEVPELGGSVPRGSAKIGRLTVGTTRTPADALVSDLAPSNASRKTDGSPPTDGTLGIEFLRRQAAVIDYPHRVVYLRPPAEN
jgi:predicted aspartyl protease